MSHATDSTSPAMLLAAANSFVAETAVKLDRLETRATAIEASAIAGQDNTMRALATLGEGLSQVTHVAENLSRDLETIYAQIDARLAKLEADQPKLATARLLEAKLVSTEEVCSRRHAESEEDYERLRLRIEDIAKATAPGRVWSLTYGVAMFSLGLITAVVGSRIPF
jgi:chromosome segregation ATPase